MPDLEEIEKELNGIYASDSYHYPGKRKRDTDTDSYQKWWEEYHLIPILHYERRQGAKCFVIGNVHQPQIVNIELPCNPAKMTYEDYGFSTSKNENGNVIIYLHLKVWDWYENQIHDLEIKMYEFS